MSGRDRRADHAGRAAEQPPLGFRTVAIERRSSEVWQVLGAVKTEFSKFGAVLDKVKKHLNTASNTLEHTGKRTRAMARKLKQVEELPTDLAVSLLGLPDGTPALPSGNGDQVVESETE